MLTNKSDLYRLYRSTAVTALMWACVGAAIACLVAGQNMEAIALLGVALMLYPYRFKFTIRKINADSFEEAMREIAKIEREERS